MSPGPDLRIGDDERDAAVRALGEHYAAGRITKQEFDERSDGALRARTAAELRPLFADLPNAQPRPAAPHPYVAQAGRPPAWRRLRPVPLLAILAVLVVVSSGAWWLLFVLGWIFFCGPRHHGFHHRVGHRADHGVGHGVDYWGRR